MFYPLNLRLVSWNFEGHVYPLDVAIKYSQPGSLWFVFESACSDVQAANNIVK